MSMKHLFIITLTVTGLAASGCSVSNAYVFPDEVRDRYVITAGDLDCPYESLGYVQLSRDGADLLGFLPVVDADLQRMFGVELRDELERSRADGIINMRFWERQWSTGSRIPFAFPLFFIPVFTYVELTGELVRIPEAAREACGVPAPR